MAVLEDGRSRERQGAVLAARREAWKPAAVAERIVTVLDDLLGTTARQRDPVIAGARR
jgi:hypothetical protein